MLFLSLAHCFCHYIPVSKLRVPFTGYLKGPECSRSLCADSTKRNKLGDEKASKIQWQARCVHVGSKKKKKVLFVCFVFSVKIPFLRSLRKPVDVQKVNGVKKLGRNGSVGEVYQARQREFHPQRHVVTGGD